MWSAPNATRCHIDLARIGLGIIDELRNRLGWNRGMNHHDVDRAQQACDRFNITNEIEIKLGIERRVNRVRRRDEKECVAVGGRPYDRLRDDIADATWSVFDHEWLAKALRQPLADQARDNVGWSARGKTDDDAHRPRWIGLRPSNMRHGRERGSPGGQMQKLSAVGKLHFEPPFTSFDHLVVPICLRVCVNSLLKILVDDLCQANSRVQQLLLALAAPVDYNCR